MKKSLVHVPSLHARAPINKKPNSQPSAEQNRTDNIERHTQIQKWVCRAFLIHCSALKIPLILYLHAASDLKRQFLL